MTNKAQTHVPWHHYSGSHSVYAHFPDGTAQAICLVTGKRKGDEDRRFANGQAIAALPDLLAFAKAHDAYMLADYEGPDSKALHPNAAENWRMCRAAIAKAEGRS